MYRQYTAPQKIDMTKASVAFLYGEQTQPGSGINAMSLSVDK